MNTFLSPVSLRRGLLRVLPVLACALLLTACGGGLTQDQFNKVENGMTEEQVKGLIGEPSKIESGSALGISGTAYIYESGDTQATVTFLNGKVMSKAYKGK